MKIFRLGLFSKTSELKETINKEKQNNEKVRKSIYQEKRDGEKGA